MNKILSIILVSLTCAYMTINCKASEKQTQNPKNTLIVYFSYSHGNTKSIAEKLQKTLHADIVCLEPKTPYPRDNEKMDKQGREEVEQQFKPELKPLNIKLNDYDRIIIGTPTWWYRMAPVILSFMSSNDFKGKTVIPFSTHAGWAGSVIKDMTALAKEKGAIVENGHAFLFRDKKEGQPSIDSPEELDKWIDSLK